MSVHVPSNWPDTSFQKWVFSVSCSFASNYPDSDIGFLSVKMWSQKRRSLESNCRKMTAQVMNWIWPKGLCHSLFGGGMDLCMGRRSFGRTGTSRGNWRQKHSRRFLESMWQAKINAGKLFKPNWVNPSGEASIVIKRTIDPKWIRLLFYAHNADDTTCTDLGLHCNVHACFSSCCTNKNVVQSVIYLTILTLNVLYM